MKCRHGREDVPHEEGDRDHDRTPADPFEHQSHQLSVCVDPRPSEFVDVASSGGIGQDPHAGFRDVFHEHGLQSRASRSEQRQHRALPCQHRKSVQEGIIRTEYHAGAQDRDAIEGLLDEALSGPPGTDIRRVRPGIGAQA